MAVAAGIHNRTIILKARQLGMSTWAVLHLLDACIWESNTSAGIVSYSIEHAQYILKKIIGYALDHLPSWLRVEVLSRSAREITFSNGSTLRVDTTLRGSAYQLVLVSEFGKTCARNPLKAEEVVTGTLQTVPKDGTIIIESTGEGNEGYFAEIVLEAERNKSNQLTALDYKLFFFPWLDEPSYTLDDTVKWDTTATDYFAKVEGETGRTITRGQKAWYVTQAKTLQDKIRQEYPSTISEAFLSSTDAYYFAEYIKRAYDDGRCIYTTLYDSLLPVYVAMDIGVNDLTVMAFFQLQHGERRLIDYYEDKNKGVDFYSLYLLKEKPYIYHTIFLPHDASKRDPLDISNTYEREFRKLFAHTETKFHTLKKMDKQVSISQAKSKMDSFVFNVGKVKKFIDQISKYRKKWSEQQGRYLDEPLHDLSSNYADCLQYTCQAIAHIEATQGLSGAFEKHKQVVESRPYRI